VTQLYHAWEHPDEEPRLAEYKALWYGAHLVHDCKLVLADWSSPESGVRELVIVHGDPKVRYEVEAALGTLAGFGFMMEPVMGALRRLRVSGDASLEAICLALPEQEPSVAETWHNWMWPDHGSTADHGDASLFAIAAARLSEGLQTVIS
jgi:hypothetical protein